MLSISVVLKYGLYTVLAFFKAMPSMVCIQKNMTSVSFDRIFESNTMCHLSFMLISSTDDVFVDEDGKKMKVRSERWRMCK